MSAIYIMHKLSAESLVILRIVYSGHICYNIIKERGNKPLKRETAERQKD